MGWVLPCSTARGQVVHNQRRLTERGLGRLADRARALVPAEELEHAADAVALVIDPLDADVVFAVQDSPRATSTRPSFGIFAMG